MSFLRTAILASALLLASPAWATDISMAGGSVSFSTPDNWLGIMQTDGDPEVRVFQVPDPSPTASNTLARVTVTVKQVGDMGGYQQYVNAALGKARALPGDQSIRGVSNSNGPNDYLYTAQESGESIAPASEGAAAWSPPLDGRWAGAAAPLPSMRRTKSPM